MSAIASIFDSPRPFHSVGAIPRSSAPPRTRHATVSHDDEAALLARLRAGEESAYAELVRRCGGRMLATARRILGDEEEARDAVQDAFLSAFRSMGEFAGEARPSTWLHRIVVNAALMRLRSRRRHPAQGLEDLLPRFDREGVRIEAPELAAPDDDDPGEALDRTARERLVRDCIARLPDSYRVVLVLRDVEELSTEDTARALQISPPNVKTRLHRARQALKTLLEREGLV